MRATNKLAKLIEDDTHDAQKTGSVDGVDPVILGKITAGSQATLSGQQNADIAIGSVTLTATQPVNKVFLRMSVLLVNGAFAQIKEGATVLGSDTGSAFKVNNVNVILTNIPVGAHIYDFKCIRNGADYQYGVTPGGFPDGNNFIFFGIIFDVNDTHDAQKIGANNDETKSLGVKNN